MSIIRKKNPNISKHQTSKNAETKAGDFNDSVVLDSREFRWLSPLWTCLQRGDPEAPLWDFSYPVVVRSLREVGKEMGLEELVPYQLRHSGASHDRLSGARTQDEARKRGRWNGF